VKRPGAEKKLQRTHAAMNKDSKDSYESVESVYGILTAAHVLAELPDEEIVGLVRFASLSRFLPLVR
jgi:hypothetical protein